MARKRPSTRLPESDKPAVPDELLKRARRVARRLYKAYPDAHCALHFESPLDLYVATVLSAQCTDERVNMVTPELFRQCRRVEDYLGLGTQRLEKLIQSTGFFRAKTKNILGGCQAMLERHDGEVPRTMEELVKIPGCGRKTANVILGNAFETPGITVDTHMGRLSRRLGFTSEKDPVKVEADLQRLIPEKDWTKFSHTVISHGREICDARRPLCEECPVRKDCPFPGSPEQMAEMESRARSRSQGPKKKTPTKAAAKATTRARRTPSTRPRPSGSSKADRTSKKKSG